MRILIATPEAVPYVKTGGLADVTGALLKEFRQRGEKTSLILPLYKSIRDNFRLYSTGKSLRLRMGDIFFNGEVWVSDKTSEPSAYLIKCDELFGRDELYGTAGGDYPDNALRYSFFSKAVIEACILMGIRPDIIHCNDWQTGMIPLYIKTIYRGSKNFKKTASLFTIHNLGYQGLFQASDLKYTGLGQEFFTPEGLEFYGKLNFMKAGLIYSDLLNAVSKTYAREILEKEYGFGLEGVLMKRREDLCGVINGIDYNEWDPSSDALLPIKYSKDNMQGKGKCKKSLLEKSGITDAKLPVFGMVGRLSAQKGLDLVAESMDEMVSLGANVVILGRGDDHYQDLLVDIAARHRGKVFVKIGFEEPLAHLIYAGSDFFLMPSRYEPCGLGQLIALKYGSIPVARRTGGLVDTVDDYNHLFSKGTGFLFSDYTPSAMQDAVKRALCVFADRARLNNMVSGAMEADFSWGRSAEEYLLLYKRAGGKVPG